MKQTMKQFEIHPMRLFNAAFASTLILVAAPAAVAQQPVGQDRFPATAGVASVAASPATAAAMPAVQPTEASIPGKPGNEGVKVHGHWKIDVRNPDGTLARRVEFENSLLGNGQGDMMLATFLGGFAVPGDWAILVQNPAICGATEFCQISTSATGRISCGTGNSYVCAYGLTRTYVATNAGAPAAIQLAGALTAAEAGNITAVETTLYYCAQSSAFTATTSLSPSQCAANSPTAPYGTGNGLTFTTLPTAVPVVAGQIVQIVVTISFS